MLSRNPNTPPSEEPFVRRTLTLAVTLGFTLILLAVCIRIAIWILWVGRP